LRGDILTRLELLIEDDERIEPGGGDFRGRLKRLWITATTWDFGQITASVEL
jgi:hypothetical protein